MQTIIDRTATDGRRIARWSQEAGAMKQDSAGSVAAAEKALADFDAAHPEIVATWDAKAEQQRAADLDSQVNYRGE